MRLLHIALLSLVFLTAASAYAQGIGSTEPFTLVINPEYPRPYQPISISPRSSQLDLSASMVVITVNGKEVERGSGQVVGYARMGAPGERSVIRVTVTSGGIPYTSEVVIRPGDVSLIAEPVSTTHPFYKGAGLVSSEGRVRLIAIPDMRTAPGSIVPPQNLIYTWRLGNQILQSASGIGKSTIDATAPVRYRDARVSVTVTTSDNAIIAYAETLISPIDPIVRIYRHDPLLGPLFDQALLGSVTMAADEESYRAVPYYFAAAPTLTWSVNSVVSGGEQDITVRASGGGAGSALLSAAAKGRGLFQTADAALSVRFGEAQGFGIFGL